MPRYLDSVPTYPYLFILSVFSGKNLDSRISFGACGGPQDEISESLERGGSGRRGSRPYLLTALKAAQT
jgi:hypothetical protein